MRHGGVLIAVSPGKFGTAVSPPLDDAGNRCRHFKRPGWNPLAATVR
jgi:glutaminase